MEFEDSLEEVKISFYYLILLIQYGTVRTQPGDNTNWYHGREGEQGAFCIFYHRCTGEQVYERYCLCVWCGVRDWIFIDRLLFYSTVPWYHSPRRRDRFIISLHYSNIYQIVYEKMKCNKRKYIYNQV